LCIANVQNTFLDDAKRCAPNAAEADTGTADDLEFEDALLRN